MINIFLKEILMILQQLSRCNKEEVTPEEIDEARNELKAREEERKK